MFLRLLYLTRPHTKKQNYNLLTFVLLLGWKTGILAWAFNGSILLPKGRSMINQPLRRELILSVRRNHGHGGDWYDVDSGRSDTHQRVKRSRNLVGPTGFLPTKTMSSIFTDRLAHTASHLQPVFRVQMLSPPEGGSLTVAVAPALLPVAS